MGSYSSKYKNKSNITIKKSGNDRVSVYMNFCDFDKLPSYYRTEIDDADIDESEQDMTLSVFISTMNVFYLNDMCKITLYECNNIISLKNISNLPRLVDLRCQSCHNLEELPDSPILLQLLVSECKKLTKLPLLSNIVNITIDNCPIASINCWPAIKYICLYNLYITELPDFPQIVSIYIKDCKQLRDIPCWDTLENASFDGCTKLKVLPCWPNAINISYINGVKKIHVPKWPKNPKLNDFLIKNQIVLIKFTKIKPPVIYKTNECIICYTSPDLIFKCGHIYCNNCSDKIYKYQMDCPMCKNECYPAYRLHKR
jgi:hypothetical protein